MLWPTGINTQQAAKCTANTQMMQTSKYTNTFSKQIEQKNATPNKSKVSQKSKH